VVQNAFAFFYTRGSCNENGKKCVKEWNGRRQLSVCAAARAADVDSFKRKQRVAPISSGAARPYPRLEAFLYFFVS
jgi:hypothetical protein